MNAPSRRWRAAAIALAGLLVATALGTWFVHNFELREVRTRTAVSPQARRNPFLAAERFLQDLGVDARSVQGRERLRDLPPSTDTLLVNNTTVALNPERREQLLAWLHDGGHLLVTASREWNAAAGAADPFLDPFGVRLHRLEEHPGSTASEPIGIEFDGYPRAVHVAFDPRRFLEDAGEEAVAGAAGVHGYHLLQYAAGEGLLTVMSDNAFLRNGQIAEHDHALYLALLSGAEQGDTVWLLYDTGMPSLGALLWQHASLALASAALLLLAWAWSRARRFGPACDEPRGARRSLLEHLDAVGHYAWRNDRAVHLGADSRARVLNNWRRRHPGLASAGAERQPAWIAEHARLPAGAVRAALLDEDAGSEREFIARCATLQRLAVSAQAPRSTGSYPDG